MEISAGIKVANLDPIHMFLAGSGYSKIIDQDPGSDLVFECLILKKFGNNFKFVSH